MELSFARRRIATLFKCASQNLLLYNSNCLLSELSRSNRYLDSLRLFTEIHSSLYLKPDQYAVSTALAASANISAIPFGSQLHAYALSSGLKSYSHVANTLLSLYAKDGDLVSSKRVFEEIENPDVYSWTTLLSICAKLGQVEYVHKAFDEMPKWNGACWNAVITGFVESGFDGVVVSMFSEMHRVGVRFDNYTFASVLSLCGLKNWDIGRQAHSLVIKTGFLCKTSVVNALISMYFKCGSAEEAYIVFEGTEIEVYDQITFNVMIDRLVELGRNEEALMKFKEMQEECLLPTELTFVSVMGSCSSNQVAAFQLHAQAIKFGFSISTCVSNAIITMYSSFGDLDKAYMVFQRLEEKDIVSWNTMISSYVRCNFSGSAICYFLEMQREGIRPDEFTFGSLLASSEFSETVEMLQALAFKNGLRVNIEVLNALISAYSKHGEINQAYHIFTGMYIKNLISWNSIISGFLLNGFPMKGLEQFSDLLTSEVKPNAYTLSIVLSICSSTSLLRTGKQVHNYILRSGFVSETSLGNGLIAMYADCGVLDWSLRVFDVMLNRDTISWNSLLSAYAKHGKGNEAVNSFKMMQSSSQAEPDKVTFTILLTACSHTGLVNEASHIFYSMVKDYFFIPEVDQLSCIVDLMGRAGYLEEAANIIQSKDFKEHSNILWALFSACAAYGDLRLGRKMANFLLEREGNNPSVYVLLSNIYANSGQWEEAANVRGLMIKSGAVKQPGCSWIG